MKKICLIVLLFAFSLAAPSWYGYEEYRSLKRSVSWTPFTPEEHPLKHLSKEQVNDLLTAFKERRNPNMPDEITPLFEDETDNEHLPSFLIGAPSEYYVDTAFPKCVQPPLNWGSCPRSDIWAITRTLTWSDCARGRTSQKYSAKNLLQCDKGMGNSCTKPLSYNTISPYSDDKKDLGIVPESCNPSSGLLSGQETCLSPCTKKCADGSPYKPAKINPTKYVPNNDYFTPLSQGTGVYVIFSALSDILNYKSGIYKTGGDLVFWGRVTGYKTYREVTDKISIQVEMGFGPNWGENGSIFLSQTGRSSTYFLSMR